MRRQMKCNTVTWSRILKIAVLLILVALFVVYAPVGNLEDTRRIEDYYLEEPNSLDVVVMGASDVYAGYSPVLAYDEYGFTSYPYVMSGNYLSLFPGQLEALLQTQSPKLIVVEITEAVHSKGSNYDAAFRQFIAGVPLSELKIRLIHELGDREHILSYYLPFFVHHGSTDLKTLRNSAEISSVTRSRGYSLLKGSLSFTGSGENWDGPYVTPINTTGDHSKVDIPAHTAEGFRQFLSCCKEHPDIQFVFVNFPHRISDDDHYLNYQITNAVGGLIEDAGFDFINLESMLDQIGIQPETDFYNNDHMNLYGKYKVTRFLCDILTKEYGIGESQLSPLSRQRWDTCVEYNQLYYTLFDYEFKTRDPDEFGLWLKEDAWLIAKLEEMKRNGGVIS